MKKEVKLPEDELPHENQAIEWWYFNGFLEGKNKYAFMTSLFKADKVKSNLQFIGVPIKTIYFSHSLFFDLTSKKIKKEVLPIVVLSNDSFSRKELFINYFYPIRKNFINYEISRNSNQLRLKNSFLDLTLEQKKKSLFEGGSGYIDLGKKSTYYYSYTNLEAKGWVGNEKVTGKVWHDKQWAEKGFMDDHWRWFSFQLADNTEIVCFDYKGIKLAGVSYPNNKQEHFHNISFNPKHNKWKSKNTGIIYNLSWEIKIPGFKIKTSPIIKNCEVNFGNIHYWEGPVIAEINGKKAFGFMELLSEIKSNKTLLTSLLEKEQMIKGLIYTG